MESGFAASEIDTTTPHPARMYDALLGGKDHYRADQEAVGRLLGVAPEARDSAVANRAFLRRAVRFLVSEAGIGQIIDVGIGRRDVAGLHRQQSIMRRSAPSYLQHSLRRLRRCNGGASPISTRYLLRAG